MEAWHDSPSEKRNFRKRGDHQLGLVSKGHKEGSNDGRIKSDVYYSLSPIYHMSKIFGLLPVKFTQDKSGKYHGRLDLSQVVYGYILLAACLGAQCWGLYRDLRNGWQNSTRLSSETAIIVTCSDVLAVISIVVVAELGSAYRWKYLQDSFNTIVDIDEKLDVVTSKHLRKASIIVIAVTFLCLFVLSTLDFIAWTLSSSSKNTPGVISDKTPINYSPLYFMYIIIMTFEIQYALVLFNVGERFLKLNKTIENLTKTNSIIEFIRKDMGLAVADTRREQMQSVSFVSTDMGHGRLRRSNKVSDFIVSPEGSGGASDAIDQLTTLHGMLCDIIININKAYGSAILMGTISCLIHLIITPYFLYNEIYSPNSSSWYVLWMQVFWIIFHVYRLLLLVQPCYMVSVKARMTGALVSQALATKWNPEAKKQFEIFSIQLLQRPVEFTACGLFFLDRGLVTSIVGSVTTYLVILVQFQNADDTKGTKHLLQNATELLKNASTFKNYSSIKI